MKPSPTSNLKPHPLLGFGAHPDDIEFACGGVIARETRAGRPAHLVVCSRGEAGTPRHAEGAAAPRRAGRPPSWGLRWNSCCWTAMPAWRCARRHAIALAGVIRRVRPAVVLAPSPVENQHPDHSRLGRMVRDAARLARYGGVAELAPQAAPRDRAALLLRRDLRRRSRPALQPVLIDVSAPAILAAWTAAMEAHASQVRARPLRRAPARARPRPRPRGRDRARDRPLSRRSPGPRARPQATAHERPAPAQDRHHLLPIRRGQRDRGLGPGRGAGAARARGPLHQLRAPVPAARGGAPPALPPGCDQRLRAVQVPRLHPAPLGQDGRGEPGPRP